MIKQSFDEWDEFLKSYPNTHILQTSSWGKLKSEFGWEAAHLISDRCGAQILFRTLPFGLKLAYIPKGPVGEYWKQFLPQIESFCRQEKAFMLKVEPDLWDLEFDQFPFMQDCIISNSIQPRRTLVVSLSGTEDEILNRMKQKTRYNIRLAEKKDISIQQSEDIPAFHLLIKETGTRDAFGVHSLSYYQKAFDLFKQEDNCALMLAKFENEPLAGIMVFSHGNRSWYFYGASNDRERNRMPTYLLQWSAMKWAIEKGCTSYDLWGVPDEELDILEENFETRVDGLWGVYRFKRGFGGTLKRGAPAFDKVFSPLLYSLYKLYNKIRGSSLG
jgi:peptidoglycan pentaglycine glycine transferase (the first glycine)